MLCEYFYDLLIESFNFVEDYFVRDFAFSYFSSS